MLDSYMRIGEKIIPHDDKEGMLQPIDYSHNVKEILQTKMLLEEATKERDAAVENSRLEEVDKSAIWLYRVMFILSSGAGCFVISSPEFLLLDRIFAIGTCAMIVILSKIVVESMKRNNEKEAKTNKELVPVLNKEIEKLKSCLKTLENEKSTIGKKIQEGFIVSIDPNNLKLDELRLQLRIMRLFFANKAKLQRAYQAGNLKTAIASCFGDEDIKDSGEAQLSMLLLVNEYLFAKK